MVRTINVHIVVEKGGLNPDDLENSGNAKIFQNIILPVTRILVMISFLVILGV